MDLPVRKPNRLKNFDYSAPYAYFITICTEKQRNIFWQSVGASTARPQESRLSRHGRIAEAKIREIPQHYPAVRVENYAVMPNHIHLLLLICADEHGRPMVAPTIATVVQQLKGAVTKALGFSPWQKSFHDRVIRNQKEYETVWEYIDNNPARWQLDCFYIAPTQSHQ